MTIFGSLQYPVFEHLLHLKVVSSQFSVIDCQVERSIRTGGIEDLKTEHRPVYAECINNINN